MSRATIAMLAVLMAVSAPVPAVAQVKENNPAQRMVVPMTTDGYLKQAILADRFQIRASKIAVERAQRLETKDFAKLMLRDHQQSTRMLKKAVSSSETPRITKDEVPDRLRQKHASLIRKLENSGVEEFDDAYLKMQVEAHQDALNLHRSYAETGDVKRVQIMAEQIAKIVEGHLEKVQRLEGARGGS